MSPEALAGILAYGLAGLGVVAATFYVRSHMGSRDAMVEALFAGALWPLGLWVVLALLVCLKVALVVEREMADDRALEEARARLRLERAAALVAAQHEVDSIGGGVAGDAQVRGEDGRSRSGMCGDGV